MRGYAEDTGEGRWTVDEAVRLAVPCNVITAALFARFASRQEDAPAIKAVAALRKQFGGHAIEAGLAVRVRRLELVDFRSYPRVEVDFPPGRECARRAERGG